MPGLIVNGKLHTCLVQYPQVEALGAHLEKPKVLQGCNFVFSAPTRCSYEFYGHEMLHALLNTYDWISHGLLLSAWECVCIHKSTMECLAGSD